ADHPAGKRPDQPPGREDLRTPLSRHAPPGQHRRAEGRQRLQRLPEGDARMNKPFDVHRLMPNDIVTEDSAAQQFVELHGDKLRYCHSQGKWFRWNGFHWEVINTNLAFHWARELARGLAEYEDNRKRYKISATSFAGGVERFAKPDPIVAVTME